MAAGWRSPGKTDRRARWGGVAIMPVMLSRTALVRAIAAIATLTALLCGSSGPRSRFAAATSTTVIGAHATGTGATGTGATARDAVVGGSLARVLGAAAFHLGLVPQGLTLAQSEADAAHRFFALVTTDLDADGDDDVIASNGALDLLVWINDGSGHLTAHRGPAPYWQEHSSSRTIEGPRDEAAVTAKDDDDDVPVAHIDLRIVWRDTAVILLPRALLDRRTSILVPTHSSRGPPTFSLQRQA